MNIQSLIWIDKYRPTSVDELIATDQVKNSVTKILERGKIPDLLLVGPPGVGKTAIARLLCESLDLDWMIVNASLKGNIDTLRNEISQFAGTVSLTGLGKCVILDEADYLNAQSTQPALRNFIDTFRENCSFVLTANYGNKIIEPLRERLETHEFRIKKADLPKLVMQMTKRCGEILDLERVPYDKLSLAKYVAGKAPNWRSTLIGLQAYARDNGEINVGILANRNTSAIADLIPLLKSKDFAGIRQWVALNADSSTQELFTDIVEGIKDAIIPATVPALFIIAARYAYQSAFVADQQINFAAALAEIFSECQFI